MTPLKREHAFFQVKSVELGGRQKVANCRQAPCVKIATFGLSWGTPHGRSKHTDLNVRSHLAQAVWFKLRLLSVNQVLIKLIYTRA